MNIEQNYLRRSYRINLPAKIIINENKYNVKDWSFLGFRIDLNNDDIKTNETYSVSFELPFVNFNMSFSAKAVCKWIRGNEAGFEFKELSDDIKLLMKEYVEAFVEGRLQEENGLLKIANGLEIPVSTDIPMSEEEESFLNKKLMRHIFIIIVFILIAAAIGYVIYLNRNSVYSEEAFVSGKTFYIKSTAYGQIKDLNISLLHKIHKNDLVTTISNENINNQIKEIKKSISTLKVSINNLKNLLNKQKKVIDKEYLQKTKQAEIQKNNLKKLIKNNKILLIQLKKQYKLGIIHITDIQRLQNKILNLKNQLKLINYPVKDYSALIQLKNMILNQQKYLSNLKQTLNSLQIQKKYFYIYSPVNGKIVNIYTKKGEFINKNSLIASVQINKKGYIIARYTFKDAPKISIGDKADIYIPANNKTYEGIVTAIGKNALKSNSIFNESNIYAQKDVPVKIKIVNNNHLEDGVFAQVEIYVK